MAVQAWMTEGYDPPVDRDAFDRLPGLPRAVPHPGDLFATLQRVIDATLAVVQVDGPSLALEHEDGSLRWGGGHRRRRQAAGGHQRELGEGPGLAAYAKQAAVTVVDLATKRRFARLAAVVTPRGLHGVLAVPVVVAGRPVGALSVYATEWCPWSGIDVAALGCLRAGPGRSQRAAACPGGRGWAEHAEAAMEAAQAVADESDGGADGPLTIPDAHHDSS